MKNYIISIPSKNNQDTIASVTKTIALGIKKYFPNERCLILNCDGNSTDKTVEFFLNADTPGVEKVSLKETGKEGKGSGLKNVFEYIKKEKADAGATFDADLKAITPEWIKEMLSPIINQGYDYVAPYYLRHQYDGTITNTIAYPLTTALYGKEIRQPIGGDFAFSNRMVNRWLEKEIPYDFGIDIFMTATALAENFKVCQAYLGPKIHSTKDPDDLKKMFMEVVSQLFKLTNIYQDHWKTINQIEKVSVFGTKSTTTPPEINIDLQKLREYGTISQEKWVETVYHYLISKEEISGLVPYYLKAAASLIFDHWNLEKLTEEFLRQKPK